VHVASIAAAVATLLAALGLMPQAIRLVRTRSSDGVSATWAAYGVVTNSAWVAYLFHEALWMGMAATSLAVVFFVLVLALVSRIRGGAAGALTAGAGWAAVLAGVGFTAGWPGLGLLLGVSYGIQVTPAVWSAYRSPAPRAIAPATWVLGGVEGLLWGWYGAAAGDLPLVMFGVVATTASVLVLVRYAVTRRRWLVAPDPVAS
jgi:uncharacterized protein with PQ loop repeat